MSLRFIWPPAADSWTMSQTLRLVKYTLLTTHHKLKSEYLKTKFNFEFTDQSNFV